MHAVYVSFVGAIQFCFLYLLLDLHSLVQPGFAMADALVELSVRVSSEGNVKLLRIPCEEMIAALERHPEVLSALQKEHAKKSRIFTAAKDRKEQSVKVGDPDGFRAQHVSEAAMNASPYYHNALQEVNGCAVFVFLSYNYIHAYHQSKSHLHYLLHNFHLLHLLHHSTGKVTGLG